MYKTIQKQDTSNIGHIALIGGKTPFLGGSFSPIYPFFSKTVHRTDKKYKEQKYTKLNSAQLYLNAFLL